MAFNDIERARNLAALKAFLERKRPPPHIRSQLDFGCAVVGQVVDVFEIRPDWQDATITRHRPFARIRFVRSSKQWRLYWMRQDLKWHAYEPSARHASLQSALDVIAADAHCCFFG
jgi:Protein of unknown function (DUF3024)